MKKITIGIISLVFLFLLIFFISMGNKNSEQDVIEMTYNISREYVSLRYQTDDVLINAKDFESYTAWNNEMSVIIKKWEILEKNSSTLEKIAGKISEEKVGINFTPRAVAYSQQEISDVFDKAPAGKKIKTLASFLGVDAKKAFQILKQDQAQVEADAWNEAGDTFQKLETSATVIKDSCKVIGFVGGVIVTGGTASLASAGTMVQAGVIVSGADLTLEVSSDAARIGLGNHNKISSIIDTTRVVTEPISSILSITSIPKNIASGKEKFDAIMVGLDQFNSTVQEGKVVGVVLPVYTSEKNKQLAKIGVSILEKNEIEKWLGDQGIKNNKDTKNEIEKILVEIKNNENFVESKKNFNDSVPGDEENKEISPNSTIENQNISSVVGIWEGVIKFTPSQNAAEEQSSMVVSLNPDGTIEMRSGEGEGFNFWEKEGNSVKFLSEKNSKDGYYEFSLSGDTMTFVKLAGPNSEGKWQEDFAGEDFFGGKFMQIFLNKE